MTSFVRTSLSLLSALALIACSSGGSVDIGDSQRSVDATSDFQIAYVKRTIPTDTSDLTALRAKDDASLQRNFWSKADIYLRASASASAVETNITASVTGTGFWDAKDLDVSPDGSKLIFALRGPLTPTQKDFDAPTWHLWQYDVPSGQLQQLTGGSEDLNPIANDVAPHYLSDGRIIFSSTRQITSKAVLINESIAANTGPFEAQTESRNESAFLLHVMNADGSDIHQISFNQSHDLDATVLANGRVMYTRWDNAPGRTGGSAMHLYTANPDGTDVQLLYGAQSHHTVSTNPDDAATCPAGLTCTVQFLHARQMQNGNVLALVRPFTGADFGGNLQIINVNSFVENNQTVPDQPGPFQPSTALAQQAASSNDVRTQSANDVPVPSPGGRFNSAFPLWDGTGRILVAWSPCRLQTATGTIVACSSDNLSNANSATPTLTLAPPLYSAWLLNPGDGTLKPVSLPTEGQMISDVVSLQPRTIPCTLNLSCPTDISVPTGFASYGVLDIRSVYDRDGIAVGIGNNASLAAVATAAAANRPARFLRFEKAVSIGDPDLKDGFPRFDQGIALDGSVGFMRQILGYVPIEPDGSVRAIVPANVAFQITVVDSNARALPNFPRHNSWLTLQAGEVLSCNGCHAPVAELNGVSGRSHGRAGLFTALNAGQGTSFNVPNGNGTVASMIICAGDTMAQELVGYNCGANIYNGAALSQDVVFHDPWFDGATNPTGPNAPLAYLYSALTTALPIAPVCEESWAYFCRSIIEYPLQLDGLWFVQRSTAALPAGGATCVNCHTATRKAVVQQIVNGLPVNVTVPVPPDGNLQLDADPAQQTTAQLRAYTQLVDTHDVLVLNGNNQLAAAGTVSGSITPGSAQASRFFAVVSGAAGGTVNHAGFMTPAELRLLSEWVDIGAQYYNNPFDAPLAN
jgi:hypothetical protein